MRQCRGQSSFPPGKFICKTYVEFCSAQNFDCSLYVQLTFRHMD